MSYGSSPSDPHEIYQYTYMPPQNYTHGYLPDNNGVATSNDEANYWTNSPRTDSPSPNDQSSMVGPYQIYAPLNYPQTEHRTPQYPDYDYTSNHRAPPPLHPPFVRVVKRRTTANKKERRRTMSINNAYSDLRDCIPNVPADTKLSKIKTLRLATSYISYLTGVLETDDPAGGFKAELISTSRKSQNHQNHQHQTQLQELCAVAEKTSPKCDLMDDGMSNPRRSKGRTGWPQHVWALELKQEQTL
ncbi:heart- and neural crest derivatives-expressed protein 2 isoform X1 [Atheta coriaria]|uniref:heart- and neural crest derivatives-expressed protein 2 isoform X1 n=1 Tax=Dalotia coriaria TaxID=877792 RepID=UPI0031F33FC5